MTDKPIQNKLIKTRRNLPHWQIGGRTYWVTWNTAAGVELALPERNLVIEVAKRFHDVRYAIFAMVVMPDHVHSLILPFPKGEGVWWDLSGILKGIKGVSACEINLKREARGAIWQDESFDHIIRNPREFQEKCQYIRDNPARAGLCDAGGGYEARWVTSFPDGFRPRVGGG